MQLELICTVCWVGWNVTVISNTVMDAILSGSLLMYTCKSAMSHYNVDVIRIPQKEAFEAFLEKNNTR